MKKILAVMLASMLLLSAAGCKSNSSGGTSSGSSASVPDTSSAVLSSGASSGAASGGASGTVSSSASGTTAASSSAAQKTAVKKAEYKITEKTYQFNQGQKSFTVEYLQLSGSGDYAAVNALLKQDAMKTVSSIGTGNTSAFSQVSVSSHEAYYNDSFLSVVYRDSVRTAKTAAATQNLRAGNYDLKNSKALSAGDLVQKNSGLTSAVKTAVKQQTSPKKQPLFTDSVVASGISGCSVFFKSGSFVIVLPVPASLGGHVELSVAYKDTSAFRTSNAVWSNFVKT